ncbi:AI-2E family transporter [Garciella nitratireducens]|uniref:Predicted PurR-regulated permease PerM n=1 Tax=Garciella nitratireducens DSM 15102 TaxID=1121911 RepID=A0A1T4PNE1_9FIRM|nr:AI-2E family transporter [Garciella nitratireducens]SJZ93052.1 Predicted PurR-regulated permease PerM [Garciella nitratireducens DSM 15102]
MKFQFDRKYLKISLYAFFTIALIILFSLLISNFSDTVAFFEQIFSSILNLFRPFIFASIFAYFLFRPVRWVESRIFGSRIKKEGVRRAFSILTIYAILFFLIGLFFYFTIPRIIRNISDLITGLPSYIEMFQEFLMEMQRSGKLNALGISIDIERFGLLENLLEYSMSFFKNTQNTIEEVLTSVINSAVFFTSGIFNIILAFFITFYILKDREELFESMRNFFYAFFPSKTIKKGRNFLRLADQVFGEYLVGNVIDSLMIGILCFLGLLLLNIKYALLISIIIAFSNLIPYFGPIFGAIPAIILTLFDRPIKAIWVALFILVLQQFDGNYLKPKILGDKVGLSPFWILFAITIGGGLFGVLGMFLGVPMVAICKVILSKIIRKQNLKKKLGK